MKRETYLSSWKTFRKISDENIVTASHLISLPSWQSGVSILDIGCGDGLILKSILEQANKQVPRVVILDPDKEMLNEAYKNINDTGLVGKLLSEQALFETVLPAYIAETKIILAIHLVYLVKLEAVTFLLHCLRPGQTLFVVLDAENSIFSELWDITAKKYIERSRAVRMLLDNSISSLKIRKTIIESNLKNPLLEQPEIRDGLLSLLCYTDITKLPPPDITTVSNIVSKKIHNGLLTCKSVCYEITKT